VSGKGFSLLAYVLFEKCTGHYEELRLLGSVMYDGWSRGTRMGGWFMVHRVCVLGGWAGWRKGLSFSSSFGVLTDRQPCLGALLMAPVHYLVMFVTKFNYSYLFFTARSHPHPRPHPRPRPRPCPVLVYDFQLRQKMRRQKLNVKK